MRWYGWFGLLLLGVSELCLWLRIEPVYSWFYCFAWWSYILLADNLLLRVAGRSLLESRRGELRRMLPLSVFTWLLFEAYNLIIRNWGYDGVPIQLWVRWPGYTLAFATVLPGIFITADLVGHFVFGPRPVLASEAERAPDGAPTRPDRRMIALGVFLSAAPLLWPRYFFPAVWIGPILLLDPCLERFGIRSLSLSIAAGERRRIWSLLLGGTVCGLLWEFWNFWAGSKWLYSVPFFGSWKIFEMPLLGFLGFPPFALECWIVYHLTTAVLQRVGSVSGRLALWAAIAVFCLAVFGGIDRNTVRRYTETRPSCHRSLA